MGIDEHKHMLDILFHFEGGFIDGQLMILYASHSGNACALHTCLHSQALIVLLAYPLMAEQNTLTNLCLMKDCRSYCSCREGLLK